MKRLHIADTTGRALCRAKNMTAQKKPDRFVVSHLCVTCCDCKNAVGLRAVLIYDSHGRPVW